MSKRAVFLDRDGTIIDDTGFIRRIEDVRLLPKAAQAIKRLNDAGWLVLVVSNQSGVARGLLTERDVAATNKRMVDLLKKEGATLDGIYYCPHLPEGTVPNYALVCDCRKPRPGLLLKAAEEHDVDLKDSVMIGDAPRDAEAGIAAGTRAILLTQSAARADQAPDACGQAPDLFAAVTEVLKMRIVERRPRAKKKTTRKRKPTVDKPEPEAEPTEEPHAAKPGKETAVTARKKTIPVRRAPKEFTPEPETEVEAPEGAEEPPTEEKPETGPPPLVRCGRCGATIPAADFELGRAMDRDGVRLCGDCVEALNAQDAESKEVTNEDLLRELKNVTRALTYERFSIWHILGGISQAAALFMLVAAWLQSASPEGLLYALFFQLLAMTFFILGRQ